MKIPGDMHILLVAREWTVDAPYLARHAGLVDPMRSVLYEGESVDEDTRAIRRSEGWRFRRRFRGGHAAQRLIVEGGVTPVFLEHLELHSELMWVRTVLAGLDYAPEDPRWGTRMGRVRTSILAHTMSMEFAKSPRGFASSLVDPEMAYGFLREFDLVLPVIPLAEAPEDAHGVEPFVGEDELASEDLRSWLAARKRLPSPNIPAEVRDHLACGLETIVSRWRKYDGVRARRFYGTRIEEALVRLTSAQARCEGRPEAAVHDADVALELVGWSWRTLAHLRNG